MINTFAAQITPSPYVPENINTHKSDKEINKQVPQSAVLQNTKTNNIKSEDEFTFCNGDGYVIDQQNLTVTSTRISAAHHTSFDPFKLPFPPSIRHSTSTAEVLRRNASDQAVQPSRITPAVDATPVGVPANPALDQFAREHPVSPPNPVRAASEAIRAYAKEHWGLDIDPDTTSLTTLHYKLDEKGVYIGVVASKQTLTQAMLSNNQGGSTWFNGSSFTSRDNAPQIKIVDSLPEKWDAKYKFGPDYLTYDGIYLDTQPQIYGKTTQVDLSPATFRQYVWDKDIKTSYVPHLKSFWTEHESAYRDMLKLSLLKAAEHQRSENSLSAEGRSLVWLACGLSPDKVWEDLTPAQIQEKSPAGRGVKVAPLRIYGYDSTDIRVITEKASGRIVLYVPGNSSPLHEFHNITEMRLAIAKMASDPAKRRRLLSHFSPKDRPDGTFTSGVKTALDGLGAYPKMLHAPDSGSFASGTGIWDATSDKYISTGTDVPGGSDSMTEMMERQRDRSLLDADYMITSDSRRSWTMFIDYLEESLSILGPIAIGLPELDPFVALLGLVEAVAGTEQEIDGHSIEEKNQGGRRVLFGLLNAAPLLRVSSKGGGSSLEGDAVSKGTPATPQEPEYLPSDVHANDDFAPSQGDTSQPPRSAQLHLARDNSVSPYVVTDVKPAQRIAQNGVFTKYGKPYQGGEGSSYIKGNDGNVYRVRNIHSAERSGTGYGSVDIVDPKNPDGPPKARLYRTKYDQRWRAQSEVDNIGNGRFARLFSQKYANATQVLGDFIKGPRRVGDLSMEQRNQFSANLERLVKESNADDFEVVGEYIHADSHFVNDPLRNDRSTPELAEFMSEFERLNPYSGPGYRVVQVTPEGAKRLKGGVGEVFMDKGVQSASAVPFNAHGWSDTWADAAAPNGATQKVIFVFDESVSKKNLSTNFLPDHIAIPAATPVKLLAVQERKDVLYVYLGGVVKMPDHIYNPFNGKPYF